MTFKSFNPAKENYYVVFGVTKDGRKEVSPVTVSRTLFKSLDLKTTTEVVTKHIIKSTGAEKYAGYKLVQYKTVADGDSAIKEFLKDTNAV